MKTLIALATVAALSASALAQGDNLNLNAPTVQRHALPPVNSSAQSEGSLQRGVRVGNPLQMFSPFAPVEYGNGREFVTARDQDHALQPRDHSRAFPIGLRLFSIAF
jgi:hypothetical protein